MSTEKKDDYIDPTKTTMSVAEMGRLLGLGKTDSYWLVHKGYFETVTVAGRMRINVESFEKWYANQIKYHKIVGEPPGSELKEDSYSIRDIAVEYKQEIGALVIPECKTLNDLLTEYISLYGKNKWAMSTYQGNVATIEHYIKPMLGDMKLCDINTRVIEKYYMQLLRTPAVPTPIYGRITEKQMAERKMVTPSTVREIHKLLRNCFNQALKWELMERNPCINATVPKAEYKRREIWTAETLFYALDVCEDQRLKLALNVTFACSLRMGELLGLTWDCVDISPARIRKGNACIYVNKELQRINKQVLNILNNKDVIQVFPATTAKARTVLVLKKPKTESSIRKVFLPKSVAMMLVDWKKRQDETKAFLGAEYNDYNLVFAGQLGNPVTDGTIRKALRDLIVKNDLPPVVFHSFRHASITYKLKLNGGDIKAVQGDSGHAQAKKVTDLYSHVLDDSRMVNAQLFEEAFYGKKNLGVEFDEDGDDSELSPEELAAEAYGDKEGFFISDEEEEVIVPQEVIPDPPKRKRGRPRKNVQPEAKTSKGKSAKGKKTETDDRKPKQKKEAEPEGIGTQEATVEQPTTAVDPADLLKLLNSPELAALVQLLGMNKK